MGDDNDTRRLTAAMAAGDAAAVDLFYHRFFPFLYGTARRATGRDEAFCLDVVQEATLRIVRAVRAADTEGQLRAWARLVVQTTALDLLRRERRRAGHEAAVVVAAPASDPDDGDDRLACSASRSAAWTPSWSAWSSGGTSTAGRCGGSPSGWA